jgi:two-component system, OmpR family, sensor histidine kinase ChvG
VSDTAVKIADGPKAPEADPLPSGEAQVPPLEPVEVQTPDQPDDAAEPTARKQGWLSRLTPGGLIARIFLINLLGLVILALGTLYFNQFRQSLIDARAQSLRTQAQIIAAAIAGAATADTGSIVVNPDSLDEGPDGLLEEGELPEGLDFPINPETAGPVLRRLLANTENRAQIIDAGGNLIVDSRYFFGSDTIETIPPSKPIIQEQWYDSLWRTISSRLFGEDYPVHTDYGIDNNGERQEVAAALNGANVSLVRLDDKRETIVIVTVPVQRFRAVLGALVLSNAGGEIDNVLRAERQVVLYTFGFATLVSLLLSALLAATIANPIRKLSDAARKVRQGISKRVEIPDFTARKDEIGRLSASMRGMTNALYNRIDAIEAFAADVSHELKNPLTSLRSAVETLSFVKKEEQRERLIEIVKQDVKRMDRLITDISDASRLDAELARTESQPVDVAKLLGAIVSMSNEVAKSGTAEAVLHVDPPRGGRSQAEAYTIPGQDSRLSQVFSNLIDNARSFTKSGSKVMVRARRQAQHIEVRVEDSGPGIPTENLERIFERFYTDRPEQSFGNNSGLGLAISRQIVDAHGGKIWAENRLSKPKNGGDPEVLGARLVVRLPVSDDARLRK